MPPTAPGPGKAAQGGTGAALAGTRDAASTPPATGRSGGHRRQRWRHRARRLRTTRPGQHRAASAAAPGRRLRAVADVTGAAVLLAGLPWGLARLAGPPLPGHWPGWQRVRESAASPLSDGTVITVLADAAWLLWAVFAFAVIAEVTAAACGRPVPRLPVIAPVQALAAALAGTIVITALHLPRLTARAGQPPHPVVTAAVTTAGPARPEATTGGGDRPGIAGRFAGNAGHRPGIVWLDAARAAGTAGRARPDDLVHTVVAGDDLWDLAHTYLGNGDRWLEIYDLNRGRPQPGGGTLTDPARIYPGWDLLIPATGPHPPPGAGRPARHPRTPEPATSGSPGPARSPHPARSTPVTGRPGARQHVPPPGIRLPSGALIGLGTAVVVSTAAALARLHRRRRYRPGTVLTSSLEPAGPPSPVIDALDRAARTSAAGTAPADGAGPEETGPELDLYEPSGQPFPGPGDPGGATPAPAPARPMSPQPPGQQGPVPAPPSLVSIGVRGGQEITADPAALGGLGLTGPGAPAAARAILAGLLARPPRGPGGTPAQIIISAADTARLLPGPAAERAHPPIRGVAVPPALDAALDEAEAMIVHRARTAAADDGPQPIAVVLAAAPGPAAAQRLAGITQAGRDLGVAAILLGEWPHGTTCHITASGLITSVTPPEAGLAGTEAYHLTAADLAAILAQLDQARQTPGDDGPAAPGPPQTAQPHLHRATAAPGPGQVATPRRPGQQPPPAGTAGQGTGPGPAGTPVQISVLGPLQITAAGREIGTGLRKARELLAFLTVHPDGATGEAISEALWPGAPPGHATRQRNIALRKARELLRAATGLATPMWITLTAGRYRLDPALAGADLWQFQAALEAARTASGDQARLAELRQAVACYRGPLADGAGYDWAEPYAETARRRALDAWARIAEILQPADPDQALSALEAAMTHDPYNEYTYQQIMRLQATAGRSDAVRRTLALLEARLGELDLTPDASTRQLAATLLGTAQPPGRGGGGSSNSGGPPGRQPRNATPSPGSPE
jgi:DNA-binding SARP family transcriptional activator